jgi:hypothetical protein
VAWGCAVRERRTVNRLSNKTFLEGAFGIDCPSRLVRWRLDQGKRMLMGITEHIWIVLVSASAWKTLPTTITNTDALRLTAGIDGQCLFVCRLQRLPL